MQPVRRIASFAWTEQRGAAGEFPQRRLIRSAAREILTTSYVLLETTALLHRRIGLEAVADFQSKIVPLLETVWVGVEWHARALQRLFSLGRKDISLVDCLSFEIMEARDLRTAFAFDKHFEELGFTLAAFHDLDARRGRHA